MRKTLNEVKQYFIEKGCELLEDKYINAHCKMKYRCSCGNISNINFNNFKSGKRCGCGRNGLRRLKEEEIKKEVESLGFVYISTNYVNNEHFVNCICKCGLKRKVRLKNIRLSEGCLNCRNQNFSFKYQEVFDYFAEQGCQLLEEKYKNARTKLKYVCNCGSESTIVFDSFKRGNRCKKCGNKKNSLKQTLTQEKAAQFFKDENCELIQGYKKAKMPVEFLCKCGKKGLKSLNNFQKRPFCKACGILKRLTKIREKYNTPEKMDEYLKSLENRSIAQGRRKKIEPKKIDTTITYGKKGKRVGGKCAYQYRVDREIMRLEHYYRQITYRVMKQIGMKPSGLLSDCFNVSGYEFLDFAKHIMNFTGWDKLGKTSYHIDHIYPVWAFDAAGIKDIKLINALDNLQVISNTENHKKSYKFNPIQFVNWIKAKGIDV
jgi:hypothetical protein